MMSKVFQDFNPESVCLILCGLLPPYFLKYRCDPIVEFRVGWIRLVITIMDHNV